MKTSRKSATGMPVGGVDPSILRELSGVYKPFIKAFKELISNAYDADATSVSVRFEDDFSAVTVEDNGNGMNPFEFRSEFTRIGGSSRRWARGKTRRGRERIGNKGIGFLALARYCDRMVVSSSSPRQFNVKHSVEKTATAVDLRKVLGVPIKPSMLKEFFSCDVTKANRKTKIPKGKYDLDWTKARIVFKEDVGPVDISITVDCSNLQFTATLDFDRLLKLADSADLEKLSDFTIVEVSERRTKSKGGTTIAIHGLKQFVKRELLSERRKGFVRNIESRSGFQQLAWQLSRCTPVRYSATPVGCEHVAKLLTDGSSKTLDSLTLEHGSNSQILTRPIYPFETEANPLHSDMLTQIDIDEDGLIAKGFIAGYESVVFPAEYRGVSIRVRGVAIGEPTFLGAEFLLTGAHKAALSQITGEINVFSGLDAVDSLNPGRESFYEESVDYVRLRRHFRGDGEKVAGFLGKTIDAVLKRSQARSSLNSALGRAGYIRRAIDDVSAGITQLITRGDRVSNAIREMLKSEESHVNGLAAAKDAPMDIPTKVAGMPVRAARRMEEAATINYETGEVVIDVSRPEWDNTIALFKRRFAVVHKTGLAHQPIAEIDFKDNRILVNWGHPARSQMDERGFLRTALAWILARTAAEEDADQMMEMAITLLSYTTQPND